MQMIQNNNKNTFFNAPDIAEIVLDLHIHFPKTFIVKNYLSIKVKNRTAISCFMHEYHILKLANYFSRYLDWP